MRHEGFDKLNFSGISLFFAVRGIATDIRQVVDLTEIKRDEREDKIISEGTEEGMLFQAYSMPIKLDTDQIFSALKLDTLLKLSESTSHDLRAAYERPHQVSKPFANVYTEHYV